MSDKRIIDEGVVDAYRDRRAPAGFAARVAARATARTRPPTRTPPLVWGSAAAVGLTAGTALVFVLVTQPPAPPARDLSVPAAPDYWAEITVPTDPPVSGLSDFGALPQIPPRPDFESAPAESTDQRSRGPRSPGTRLTQMTRTETIHEDA